MSGPVLAAVPVIEPPQYCESAWTRWDLGSGLLIIDNSAHGSWAGLAEYHGWQYVHFNGRNLGVSGAWNVARDRYLDWDDDYDTPPPLMLFSASVIWHEGLGAGWAALVDEGPRSKLSDMGWHAIALSARCLDACGAFDENLWPGYHNDTDYGRRMRLLDFHEGPDSTRWLNKAMLADEGRASCIDAKAINSGLVPGIDWRALEAYVVAKWGATGGGGHQVTPFGLDVPVGWWSPSYRPGLGPAVDRLPASL